jgi:hypothetical protein
MAKIFINELTEIQAKKCLEDLIDWLDSLDDDDFFGTEGWQHFKGED